MLDKLLNLKWFPLHFSRLAIIVAAKKKDEIIIVYNGACYIVETHRRNAWAAFKNFNEIDVRDIMRSIFNFNCITLSIKLLTCGAIITKRIIAVVV